MLMYQKFLLRALNPKPYSCLCSCNAATNTQYDTENVAPPSEALTLPKGTPYMPTSMPKLRNYLKSEVHLFEMCPYIPEKYLKLKRRESIENMYLIDTKVAKDVVSQILPIIQKNKKQIVCETNAGLGLISSELLDHDWPMVRLYEICVEFRTALKEFNTVYPGRVELFSKDLYHAYSLKYLDNIDNGHRIEQILRDVPKKDWSDEPVMTVIGPMPNNRFIKYLIKTLVFQTDIAKYGRPQIFAFMVPKDYIILTANTTNNLHTYQYWSVLFKLFFDWKLLKKYTRKAFLPWEQKITIGARTRYASRIDVDYTYFVQLEFKKQLPVEPEKLLHLYYFVKQFFGRGTNLVIPTLEKWFPGFGMNVFLPQCEHDENFPKHVDLCTTFGQLNPQEIFCLFKEFVNHPNYESSPFLSMIDSHLVKTETIESDMVIEGELDKETVEELEEKFVT